MKQYLEDFDLGIENMKSESCNQPFVFGPSKRYISNTVVYLPILVTRMDGIDDVLIVKTYLVDAEVPFLCGKQTLESWNFKIDGIEKILEIQMRREDNDKKYMKMEDTHGGHFSIILETKKEKNKSLFLMEEDRNFLLRRQRGQSLLF